MSRGFKITRQDGLNEQNSNLAPWLKNFAGKESKLPTVVEQIRQRDAKSLVNQINSIMGSKSRYATVADAVNDMKERTGLDTYLNQLTANSKENIKIAEAQTADLNQDGNVDNFEIYMRETDFDPSHTYFEIGLTDGEEDLGSDLVGDVLSAIRLRNFVPDLTNYMNFGLGYVIGAKLSKEEGNKQLKRVYDSIKKKSSVASFGHKKKVNKTAQEWDDGMDDVDPFDYFMSETDFNTASYAYQIGFEDGEIDAGKNQVGDILGSAEGRHDVPYSLKSHIEYGIGYCYGAKMSSRDGKNELKRIYDFYKKNHKMAQLDIPTSTATGNKIPESLSKYPDVVDNIVSFIRNNIRNTNALGASVPAIQHDLLALFGQRYGVEAQDVMNEDVARFINNIIVSELSTVGPETHNPNLGFGVGKDFGDSDNTDAFKGLMPVK